MLGFVLKGLGGLGGRKQKNLKTLEYVTGLFHLQKSAAFHYVCLMKTTSTADVALVPVENSTKFHVKVSAR
jgi:prephenate dehydratase